MAETGNLPPDQRAVLQLLLRQGRGYDDLASVLRISPDAVRARARAGVGALAGPGPGLDPELRARVADYLLAQQGVSERATTRRELASSSELRAWAAKA